jgi:hypothetical protein
MKTSRRLLFGTFVVLLAAPVVLVAFSRMSGTGLRELPPPERTPAAELATLRDFTRIDVSGDFELEVLRANSWTIDYTPLSAGRGNFKATVVDGTLTIEGFGNRSELARGVVRIGMPALEALHGGFIQALAISNFDGAALEVNIEFTEQLELENNRLGTLQVDLQQAGLVNLRGNTFGSSRVTHFGTTITTD